jgi:hypothetical protein
LFVVHGDIVLRVIPSSLSLLRPSGSSGRLTH